MSDVNVAKSVKVIDSPKIVALALKSKLDNLGLLNADSAVSSNRFQKRFD